MPDEEQLIAEQVVSISHARDLTVRISQAASEEFWRVSVDSDAPAYTHPPSRPRSISTTVAPGENFMIHLIQRAVGGEQLAWQHLASWGQDNLARPALAPRRLL